MKVAKYWLIFVFLPTCFCLADDGEKETRGVLEKTIQTGVEILKNDSLDNDGKIKAFNTLLNQSCHLDLMAMLSLGKTHWLTFTPAQRQEFVNSYGRMLIRSYYDKVKKVNPVGISVVYTKNEAVSPNKRSLEAVMGIGDESLHMMYKFFKRKTGWGIYDVEVEGVSLIVSYRSQFNDFLATRTPADLLKQIHQENNGFTGIAPALDTPKKK